MYNSRHFKGKWKGRLARWECEECGCPSCVVSPTISIFYLPFKCLTRGLCDVWFWNNAHCIQSRFSPLQKEAKTRQWKAVKNILKVNWIENKNISASLYQGEELGINLITISQEARGSGGKGGQGEGGVVAGFDQDANKCMTSIGISYLVISFAL